MTNTTDAPGRVLHRVEACYDALPREAGARVEECGPFVVFLRNGPGWHFYARPRLGDSAPINASDVRDVLDRLRALEVPEAIEWVDEATPSLLPAARALRLPVVLAPLMVLDPAALPSAVPPPVTVRLLDPDDPGFADDMATSAAVANLGFGAAGTAIGPAGPAERDAARVPFDPDLLAYVAAGIRRGQRAEAVARDDSGAGILARGATQAALGRVEIVGVATLPAARRRGLGAAVSARLARHALTAGAELVFLGAADENVARVYASIGFRRIGTACILEAAG